MVVAWHPAQAAPTTETAPVTPSSEATSASVLNGGPIKGAGRSGESNTIDMLVEMQQSSAGIQFNERQRAADARARGPLPPSAAPTARPAWQVNPAAPGPAPAAAATPPVSQAGLFGSGAAPQMHQAPARTAAPAVGMGDGSPAPAARAAPAEAEHPQLARWLALPRDFINYLRDNRSMVLGTVLGLLAAGWVGSVLAARLRA